MTDRSTPTWRELSDAARTAGHHGLSSVCASRAEEAARREAEAEAVFANVPPDMRLTQNDVERLLGGDAPPPPAPVCPCDDDEMFAQMVLAVQNAVDHRGRRIGDTLDHDTVRNIVLQITEGSSILDDLIARHTEAMRARAEAAEAEIYVPGIFECPKCKLTAAHTILSAKDGTMSAASSMDCANGCGPAWRVTWKHRAQEATALFDKCFDEKKAAEARVRELEATLNTPEIHDFSAAVVREAAHQRERWGSRHDAGKTDADWFWLIGYLAGKALHNPPNDMPPVDARLHRIVTVAAAAANWHAAVSGASNVMRPGIEPPNALAQGGNDG